MESFVDPSLMAWTASTPPTTSVAPTIALSPIILQFRNKNVSASPVHLPLIRHSSLFNRDVKFLLLISFYTKLLNLLTWSPERYVGFADDTQELRP